MKRKILSGITLTLLFIGMLTLAFKIQPVMASGTIYIRADGSVEPSGAPILSVDNVTYTFTADINESIVVERDNIVVDGAGYTLQGTGSGTGVDLTGRSNVTIKNIEIKSFSRGIWLSSSLNNSISGNNITNNKGYGIWLHGSNNVLKKNSMVGNQYNFLIKSGIFWWSLSDFLHDIDSSNTVDGKPVYYWINRQNERVPADAGYVALVNSVNITVKGLELKNHGQGLLLVNTTNSQITNNNITNNMYGVYLFESSSNTISGNNITNSDEGVWLHSSSGNIISGNSITNTRHGVQLGFSSHNRLFGNNIRNNSERGVGLAGYSFYNTISGNNITNSSWGITQTESVSNNKIYHNNFIDNTRQVSCYDLPNVWDDGYPSGGNYWGDYTGVDEKSGPNQDLPGSDGVGDTQFVITANNRDRYPLMTPWPSGPGLHELEVTLKAPTRLPPGNSTLLEATVSNKGFNNETNVTLSLFVDNTVVNSTTISLLKIDSSHTINYLWTPTVEDRVNVTAYATPVPREIYIANNLKTLFVTISSVPPVQNINTGLYYDTIQEAIDAPETFDGHTIKVEAGTYYERLTISKSLKIIGEDRTNTIIDGNKTGIFVVQITANNVVLSGFTIQNSNFAPTPAIRLYSSNNIISNNIIINNGWGIYAFSVSNNTIENNIITNNEGGINLEWVTTHTVKNNTIANHHQRAGIYFRESRNNIFTNNIIKNNKDAIRLVDYSNNNKFYHNNFINNTSPGFAVNSDTNIWDDGYPSGGNYWSDYTGDDLYSGPYQNKTGSDGIGDTLYSFYWPNRDNYPLMNPMGSPQPPIAIFTYSPEHPVIDETATFNATSSYDRDGSIISYKWDFGDENVTTVTDTIITHVYATPSTYTVNLTVTDNDGLNHSITKSITIEKISSTITVNVDPATATVGSNVTINGTITPVRVDVNVTISYRPLGGTWATLATVKTDPNSQYTYTWKTTDEGIYEIKASWQGDENTTAAESETKTAIADSTPPTTLHDYDGLWHTTDFTITLTATDNLSDVAETYYKINDGATKTVSINGQPLITTEGTNNKLEYWSKDNAGNEELPHKILTGIKLDKTAPTIGIPSRIPDGDVLPDQPVKVLVNVTDIVSEVKNITLSYTINDEPTWTNLPMNYSSSTGLYEATIPPQPAQTWIKYKIVAYDYAGNNATLDGTEPYCTYQVIPEFPPTTILPLFIILSIVTVIFVKLKKKKQIIP